MPSSCLCLLHAAFAHAIRAACCPAAENLNKWSTSAEDGSEAADFPSTPDMPPASYTAEVINHEVRAGAAGLPTPRANWPLRLL